MLALTGGFRTIRETEEPTADLRDFTENNPKLEMKLNINMSPIKLKNTLSNVQQHTSASTMSSSFILHFSIA